MSWNRRLGKLARPPVQQSILSLENNYTDSLFVVSDAITLIVRSPGDTVPEIILHTQLRQLNQGEIKQGRWNKIGILFHLPI
jgi:hypothetical protein